MPNSEVLYTLSMPEPSSHYFEVGIHLGNLSSEENELTLKLPVWRTGRYLIFDFASGVQEFSASDAEGKPFRWSKTDKSSWRIEKGAAKNVLVKYRVFANEFSLRTRGLDDTHAFVNGMAVFMYSDDLRDQPLSLLVKPFADWHVTTGLDNAGSDTNKFTAPNYDYLVDCPLEIGNQTDFDFMVEGKRHVISFYGEAKYDRLKLIDDFSTIIKKNYEFWGSVPYDRYVFIVHCTPQSGGGTEHINSTVVGVRPNAFDTDAGYKAFLGLISHEFFHTWNVKQLKPKGLTPYDFSKENYTSELWIAEGGTSYYDGLMLVRTGQMDVIDFFKEISSGVEEERRRPGNRIQSVAESSFDAWVKFWRRTPNTYGSESDYYSKGSHVCIVLDLEIRNASGNKYSLDDVFRSMYERFPLDKKGYTNEDFQKVCEEFVGKKLDGFFNDYVTGTAPIAWEKYLNFAGLELKSDDSTMAPVVGLYASKKGDKIVVDEVLTGSASEKAGLMSGDEIVAFDGLKLPYEEMEKRVKALNAGESITLMIFRNDKLREFKISLANKKMANYYLEKTANPSELQKGIYEKWVELKW
ncbi:MAG: PDZ domain-containing protein [Ignavibacteria bacterium]|nr:PDZ domain-containing protein [Ignavibacteria bacterium]